jgi:hypothetical protein
MKEELGLDHFSVPALCLIHYPFQRTPPVRGSIRFMSVPDQNQ